MSHKKDRAAVTGARFDFMNQIWLFACLSVLIMVFATARADAESENGYWAANYEWLATRTDLESASAADGAAEVFDSSDYQFMLIFGVQWNTSFCLDLASSDVIRYALSDIQTENNELVAPASGGELLEMFTFHDDGHITFTDESFTYTIEPAPPLVGEITLATLNQRLPIYSRRAAAYTPQPAVVAELAKLKEPIELIAFFGSWCQLCKHHLPSVLATVAAADNPNLNLTLIAMDENMTMPLEWIDRHAVGATPTIIVLSGGVELGRIEEEPLPTAEEALVEIITAR